MKKTICLFVVFIFGLNTAATATETPDPRISAFLRGERVHSPEAEHFTLDNKTLHDLEYEKALLPYFDQFAPSALGKLRLRWLLTHPLAKVEDIRERQELIKFLASDPIKLKKLRGLFEKTNRALNSVHPFALEQKLTRLQSDDFSPYKGTLPVMAPLFAVITIGAQLVLLFNIKDLPNAQPQFIPLMMLPLGGAMMMLMSQLRTGLMTGSWRQLNRVSKRLVRRLCPRLNETQQTLSDAINTCRTQKTRLSQTYFASGLLVNNPLMDISMLGPLTAPLVSYKIRQQFPDIVVWLSAMAELEAYTALASYYLAHKDQVVFAEFESSPDAKITIEDGHLPYLKFMSNRKSIGNSVALAEISGPKASILTGPNAGGKSTFMRVNGTLTNLAQTGAPVPARFIKISPTGVFTNFAQESDSTIDGVSTFRAQSNRAANLFKHVAQEQSLGRNTIIFMDEVLVGTSEDEHSAAEHAVLMDLVRQPKVLGILATHFRGLSELADTNTLINNLHVRVNGFHIDHGPSSDYNAFDVMREEGIPERVIEAAEAKFKELRQKRACMDALWKEHVSTGLPLDSGAESSREESQSHKAVSGL